MRGRIGAWESAAVTTSKDKRAKKKEPLLRLVIDPGNNNTLFEAEKFKNYPKNRTGMIHFGNQKKRVVQRRKYRS